MPENEVLVLYAILEEYGDAADEMEDVLDSFELARAEFETAFFDLCDELDAVMEHLNSCRKNAIRRKRMHRQYLSQDQTNDACENELTA